MSIIQLTPDNYSDARREAMEEIYGENWKEKIEEERKKYLEIKITKELQEKIANDLLKFMEKIGINKKYYKKILGRSYKNVNMYSK